MSIFHELLAIKAFREGQAESAVRLQRQALADAVAAREAAEQLLARLLREGVEYPPTFLLTSTRDDRVHPGHARKLTAALESLGADVRSWENIEGGHGGAASNEQAARMSALMWAFLWSTIGAEGKDA